MYRQIVFLVCVLTCMWGSAQANMLLRDNLKKAQVGDFIVTAQSKAYTLFHIYGKAGDILTIEEITVPNNKASQASSWREWVRLGAPSHTNWILYTIQLSTGNIQDCFSVSKNGWYDMAQHDSFLPTLLNLQFRQIPHYERKKVGPRPHGPGPDLRTTWNPKMVLNGVVIAGVKFEGWRTHWPKDNSELSGKRIEVYLPAESDKYPSYFPYWLQIKGAVGAATLRIVDSGAGLVSPAGPMPTR